MSSVETSPGAGSERLRVVHLLKEYLPYSCPWIFHQIVGPCGLETLTIAWEGQRKSLQAFPNPGLYCLSRSRPLLYGLTRPLTLTGMRSITGLARAALSAFSPDVAHAHFGHHAWFYLPVLKAMNLPLVVSFYGHDMSELPRIKPMWRRRYTELFSYGQLFFCEGPAMAAGLERLGCPAPRIRVKRLGVDCDKRVVSPRKFEVGEELKVLVVARMTEKKGIPDAVRAVAAASRHIPIKLTIVGDAAPGSKGRREEKRILEAISACRLEAFVNLTGRVAYTNLVRLALQHDVLLQPSRTSSTGDTEGGIPVSLIELGATGMAAVATRHADIPEVVRDGENGFLTDEGDIEGLASALIRLATTPGLVGAMGTAMACWLEREFSQKECHARLIDLYREALRA